MYFEQFYLACLSHASYMIGSEGVAAVVDPRRDIGIYLEEAEKHGFWIEHVIETHLHRDFVSGHAELAALTGAKIHVSHQANAKFPHVPVRDGDEIAFGGCRLRFLETPGHSIDSICVLVTDLDRSPNPFAILTGDTLFIGDVGRPDLSPRHTPEQLAALLYRSLHETILKLPDDVEVHPAHGAGSLCGRQLSTERLSTIGKERAGNYALRTRDPEEFVRLMTTDLPERPGYFQYDAEVNRQGARPLAELPPLAALPPRDVAELTSQGVVVLDTRSPEDYAAAHIPGSIQIGLRGQYASWAGTLLRPDQDLILIADDRERAEESRLRLTRVGIERVVGYLEEGIASWAREGLEVAQMPTVSAEDLHRRAGEEAIQILDVRRPAEWDAAHLDGAILKPLDSLSKLLDDVDRSRPVAVHCKSGYRSIIAASLLERAGFSQVMNVTGGIDAWLACGLPTADRQRRAGSATADT